MQIRSVCRTAILVAAFGMLAGKAPGEVISEQFRRPVNLAVFEEGIVTANQRSGTLSWIDPKTLKVKSEVPIGGSPSDVVFVPARKLLLATDEARHELIAIQFKDGSLKVQKRLPVRSYPVTIRTSDDGKQAYVASLWSKTVSIVDLEKWLNSADADPAFVIQSVVLPFSPREIACVDKAGKLVVADAFGARLAVVDLPSGDVESVRELPAHGIRGLRQHPSKSRLLMTHQMLSKLAHTTLDDVHWGGLMVNCLRSLPIEDVLSPQADPIKTGRLDYLGGPEQGAGDPAGIVISPDGIVAIALSGTNEVAFDDGNLLYAKRVTVGERPTAMALAPDGRRAYVVNTLSDSVSVLDMSTRGLVETISLGPQPAVTAADRGERLFYSARLSHDRWLSCASCHVDGHTNGQLNDNFTDGTFGTAKRVLSLRGAAESAPYAWSGRFPQLADQIRHSIASTMQGEELPEDQLKDLEAYVLTLPPAPAVGSADVAAVERGGNLFGQLQCGQCHAQPSLTSKNIVDVNLRDERGHSTYNPPSLRGVSQNAPFFHDGRAPALSDVFQHHQHQVPATLTAEQVRDLVEYLNSL